MIEVVPNTVDTALLYFHTRCSSGDEIRPFLDELRAGLPTTYLWAGDGVIDGSAQDPVMGQAVSYGRSAQRYWFVFPMHGFSQEDFTRGSEAMGAVLATCGGYVNALVDQVTARFHIPAARVVLCGHQHGSCVALAAAMMRRHDPFALTLLFDPWPWETLYFEHEQHLPPTRVVCVDNVSARERESQRGAAEPLYRVFQHYGINADGVTLPQGGDIPDAFMFREAIQQIKTVLG